MAVLLTGAGFRSGSPRLLDFGGELTPPLGAEVQRLNRLGMRHAIDVVLPPLRQEPQARLFLAKLKRAKVEGALYQFPQYGLKVGAPGAPVVDGAVAGGSVVPMRGLTAHYSIREGQYFSIIHGGRRYLYSADAAVIADAAGEALVPVFPLLRCDLSDGDVVELAKPMIEGLLGDIAWEILREPMVQVGFSISEAA